MNPAFIREQASILVRTKLLGEKTGHDWGHITRVTAIAGRIAQEEGADPFICELAALFHDLADEKLVESKEEGLQTISNWLAEHRVDSGTIAAIIEIIATMSYRGGNGKRMSTLEGRIVQDADRLDAIGAIGIARTFVYAGAKGHPIHDPDAFPRDKMTEAEYRHSTNTAINHFHEKLLRLKDLMNTSFAKRLAEERHAFMERYLIQFHAEWMGIERR